MSGGLDNLLTGGATAAAAPGAGGGPSNNALLGDIFGLGGSGSTTFYIPPKQEWLSAAKGKGLEVHGTFSRKNGTIFMDMTFANKAMQPMSGFGIQFNKNSFGLTPAQPLNVPAGLLFLHALPFPAVEFTNLKFLRETKVLRG